MFKMALVFTFLLLAADTVGAKVFKWVDKNGETQYSEKVPPEQQGLEIKASPSTSIDNGVNNNQSDKIMQELKSSEKRRNSNSAAQGNVSEAAARKYRCTEARRRLAILQQQVRIFKTNANGERVYLDDDTRDDAIKKLSEIAASSCEN